MRLRTAKPSGLIGSTPIQSSEKNSIVACYLYEDANSNFIR